MKPKIIGIIPARFNSKRFKAKLLYNILGKPLVQHTFENAKKASILDDIYIATDDDRIAKIALKLNAKYIMTSKNCKNGTERIIDALNRKKELLKNDIIVNIQADHPKISPVTIKKSIDSLLNDPSAVASTAITKINYEIAKDENIVKCIFDKNKNAMYFSRSLIPFSKDKLNTTYYYHIGLYCYRTDFLLNLLKLNNTTFQDLEDLEQLKILENGYKMKVAIVNDMPIGVDVFDDVKKVEKVLCK